MKHSKRDLNNYKRITVEPVQNYKAVIIGIALIGLFFFIRNSYIKYSNRVFQDHDWFYALFLIGIPILSRFIFLRWIRSLSDKIGKNVNRWTIYGLISPNISLIMLGLSDLKLQSEEANTIVLEKRKDYGRKVFGLKEDVLEKKELKRKLETLKKDVNEELQEALKDYYSK
ncbi:hypothetical protein [Aquimarina aquimarini]|uniref:hypothetical protein n=1 Tax=Aquimarina aquimarini TaxID=1191734 RepID=UPI000D55078B|nr:hypothetical protein [Aquimarina aquimarini]